MFLFLCADQVLRCFSFISTGMCVEEIIQSVKMQEAGKAVDILVQLCEHQDRRDYVRDVIVDNVVFSAAFEMAISGGIPNLNRMKGASDYSVIVHGGNEETLQECWEEQAKGMAMGTNLDILNDWNGLGCYFLGILNIFRCTRRTKNLFRSV